MMGDKMGSKGPSNELIRFDLLLPRSTIEAIEKMAEREAIPPRTLGRSLLVKAVRELVEASSGSGEY